MQSSALPRPAPPLGRYPGSGRMRIFVGGASPPTSLIQRVTDELGWEFTHGYGLTESSPLLTVNLPPP